MIPGNENITASIYMQTVIVKHYNFEKILESGLVETFQEVQVEQFDRIKMQIKNIYIQINSEHSVQNSYLLNLNFVISLQRTVIFWNTAAES